jgi:hypothetical protein
MSEVPGQQGSQPIKFTVTHHRQPAHSHEDFITWIVDEHLPLAIPIFKKHGAIGYSLVSSVVSGIL